jgi:endonuclease/exonuclease/phosphatase (EEP) superfamily protein YafD
MRIVAWNCCEQFDRKYFHLRDLDFDVAVVTECGPFEPGIDDAREVTSVLKPGTDKPGHRKHIGVLARSPWRVEPLPLVADQPWLLPALVTGPVDLTVLAVWALGPEWVDGRLSYAAQTARVVSEVLPTVDGPVVLAGDLNAPIAARPSVARQHADSVMRLEAHGLVSAFSATRGDVDPLSEPTFYHLRKADQPFHIDHVFVPKEWTSGIRLAVGGFDDWVATGRSDHVPLTVDVLPPQLSQ